MSEQEENVSPQISIEDARKTFRALFTSEEANYMTDMLYAQLLSQYEMFDENMTFGEAKARLAIPRNLYKKLENLMR